jgi:hypothetical protein
VISFIREQLFSWSFSGQLRSVWRTVSSAFMPNRPPFDQTIVDYNFARQLYRNDGPDTFLGAGFCRPIIDLTVEYMDLPRATSGKDAIDTFLNDCIHEFWAADLQQMFRDATRDSKIVMRYRQPLLSNPLFTDRDRQHGCLDCVPPESVEFFYDPTDPDLVMRAQITHWIKFPSEQATNVQTPTEMFSSSVNVGVREHQIIEIVTPERYRFFDLTDNKELDSWGQSNTLGFVPLWEVWNEYAVDLGGGRSDLEPIVPFVRAFHEVLDQALKAHKYHSTPKIRFKVKDVGQFLYNNWPEVLDPATNRPKSGSTINWEGREIIFTTIDEDIDFVEARSVLGDSKTLLEFLIDCICIAASVPKWALMKVDTAADKNAAVAPFEKKIERKRKNFAPAIQMLCKMALAATGERPETIRFTWPPIRIDQLVSKGQAIQQLIMGLDVASQHHWIADDTAIEILAGLFPEIKSPSAEQAAAADNFEPPVPAGAPASSTQPAPSPARGTNGTGSQGAARKALTTTTPSRS